MSDEINIGKVKATGRIEPIFWEDKRFIAVQEVLKENPRRDNVAGWHSLQLIRQGREVGISYRDWKDSMPTDLPNTLGTNHTHLKWDWDHGHIRVFLDIKKAESNNRVRGKGAPSPQKTRAGFVMENVGSTTYALKIYHDTELRAFKLGRSEDPKARQELFNLHSMPGLGGLHYVRFLEYSWSNNGEF